MNIDTASYPSPREATGEPSRLLLQDTFGRVARDLRVSLTDKCNLRCTYCMPAEGLNWLAQEKTLSDEEVCRLLRIAVERLGIRHLRFTGGEPLLRRSLPEIIAFASSLRTDEGRAPRTALTTNGLGLDKRAAELVDAGLDRVNISLDSLDRHRYHVLSRRDRLDDVLASIDAALQAGLSPVKINTVVMPGSNEQDILPLAHFALRTGAQLRFIEQMPLGPPEQWDRNIMITARDIVETLAKDFELSPSSTPRGSAPAELWTAVERDHPHHSGEIGVIAAVTHPFCGDCDRSRLTADGFMRNCLFSRSETDLRSLLRSGASDEEIMAAWAQGMAEKKAGHGIDDRSFIQPQRLMSEIGG
ncbi:Cyclic pyranopterin monophosphate synthase [Corynebacterium ciconiae DSM 44920]|uniref:GTP 3',8-cyclase MoaA n=1 Tax=Corynebacterium ciconiae TaxID=227319 RepID=UPI00035FDBBA|nr:GTP 3',8-cyclase MoaA [Corynebacterium ciconiae]WKD60977.1 Cyclic pyranopterin monophosphate synthase [Corynebacterium ciconiae DSM 44920]